MFHDNIDTVIPEFVLSDAQFLQANIVLEHLSEMNCYTLTDSSVYWVVNVQLLKIIVTRIEHREDSNNSIMVNFIVSKV